MKIKVSVIATTILLASFIPKANSAVTVDDIKNLLGKYCYPAKGSTCADEEYADYDAKTGYCNCKKDERYWDINERTCKECELSQVRNKTHNGCVDIVCPTGYGGQVMTTCPKGYGLVEIKNGKCPNGMILWKFEDK